VKDISFLGIDLAKSTFQIHGLDCNHKTVLRKKLTRSKLFLFMANLPEATVFMEACTGAHFFAKKFMEHGHVVKLIAPQFVKPFVRSNKNDRNDAEAIVEAGLRPSMNFVSLKSSSHLDLQAVHKIRRRLVKNKTALMNEIRGLLAEQGVIIAKGEASLKKVLAELLRDSFSESVSGYCKETIADLHHELLEIEERIQTQTARLERCAKENETAKRLQTIPGVGLVTSTAMLCAVSDPSSFKNGRQFAAWLGLVPRHTGTGGKNKVLGISKRGDRYASTGGTIYGADLN
jgi:transposase